MAKPSNRLKLTSSQRKFAGRLGLGVFIALGVAMLVWTGFFSGQQIFINDEVKLHIKPMFLCRRGPEIRVMDPQYSAANSCAASAKIQVVRYECGRESDVRRKTNEFLQDISDRGQKTCAEFCSRLGSDCVSTFQRPASCGYSVPDRYAIAKGEQAGCHGGCAGKAFIYCSIYHAGFLTVDKEMLEGKFPNCRCRSR